MQIRETQCDVKGCKNRNASSFSIFSERKADAAGGMEDWNHMFDLCPSCAISILRSFMSKVTPDEAPKLLTLLNIESRIG